MKEKKVSKKKSGFVFHFVDEKMLLKLRKGRKAKLYGRTTFVDGKKKNVCFVFVVLASWSAFD